MTNFFGGITSMQSAEDSSDLEEATKHALEAWGRVSGVQPPVSESNESPYKTFQAIQTHMLLLSLAIREAAIATQGFIAASVEETNRGK
jgi:hypothetical protein